MKLFALWGFLIGIAVIVFLQFISGQNINRLAQANVRLLQEIEVQNDIRAVQADILTIESDVRGALIAEDDFFLRGVESKISGLRDGLNDLKRNLRSTHAAANLAVLEDLVNRKIRFSYLILDTFRIHGKAAGEALISTGRGRLLRDSIEHTINVLDSARQAELRGLITSIEQNGNKARTWGFSLAALACVLVIIAFWFIINQSREQARMITYLNQSERRIKEASNMKEQFMANMSHEIRTPMNAIIGFSNLLRRTPLNSEQWQFVQNIHSASENLLALVNDILDLSKIEAGMMQLEEVRFSIRSLVSSVGAMFLEKVKEKAVDLQVQVDPNVPDILSGDAVRLTQVLVNLLSNAIKFTEEGRVEVAVHLRSETEERVRIRIEVRDTGIGIPADKQAAIFERFQQAELTTTRRYGGTGLGLSIVKQLVEMQHGTIHLNSTPGKGSTFTVELEYGIPDADEMLNAALASEAEPVVLNRIRVLVAEDNVMNQQLVRHLMQSWGIDFTIVSNGQDAVDAVRSGEYSIVLMDMQMPVMDGYTATGVIRNELHSDIPIIAMTAHAMVGEKEKCIEMGMNDYVSKPIKEEVLYNIIARFAQQAPRPDEAPGPALPANRNAAFQYIDFAYLQELSGGSTEFEREMLQQFRSMMPEELDNLEKAIRTEQYGEVRQLAHGMKSSVSYVGMAEALFPHLDAIEDAAGQGDRERSASHFATVRAAVEGAVDEVHHFLEGEER
ncbi:MAG TPA: ATP-binding protein [Chitinophagaceae bacterium]|nr:ATP-binding protein [Chitinophagaceae bacterium]